LSLHLPKSLTSGAHLELRPTRARRFWAACRAPSRPKRPVARTAVALGAMAEPFQAHEARCYALPRHRTTPKNLL
jgi:hypothetical protein